jgi:hypothetical protein
MVKRVEYSVGEDSHILDIAENPAYANSVPFSAWKDAVNTGDFGKKTARQVQSRNLSLRRATKKRADAGGPALLRVGPPWTRRVLIRTR